jgi:hypothetical protein
MRAIILAVCLVMVPMTMWAQQSLAGPRVRVPREHLRFSPRSWVPSYVAPRCEDPGAHVDCPAAPVHDNSPPPS